MYHGCWRMVKFSWFRSSLFDMFVLVAIMLRHFCGIEDRFLHSLHIFHTNLVVYYTQNIKDFLLYLFYDRDPQLTSFLFVVCDKLHTYLPETQTFSDSLLK